MKYGKRSHENSEEESESTPKKKRNKSVLLSEEDEKKIFCIMKQTPILWSGVREFAHYKNEDKLPIWGEIGKDYDLSREYILIQIFVYDQR